MELLEGPDNALGVVLVQSLVVIIKVDPTGLSSDVAAPILGVFQYGGLAKFIELSYSKFLDLWSAGYA